MTFDEIAAIVSEYVQIPIQKFIAKRRKRELVYARYLCMFFCKQYTMLSLKSIGFLISGRDHTTVMNGVKELKALMDTNETVREDVQNINNNILQLKINKTDILDTNP